MILSTPLLPIHGQITEPSWQNATDEQICSWPASAYGVIGVWTLGNRPWWYCPHHCCRFTGRLPSRLGKTQQTGRYVHDPLVHMECVWTLGNRPWWYCPHHCCRFMGRLQSRLGKTQQTGRYVRNPLVQIPDMVYCGTVGVSERERE